MTKRSRSFSPLGLQAMPSRRSDARSAKRLPRDDLIRSSNSSSAATSSSASAGRGAITAASARLHRARALSLSMIGSDRNGNLYGGRISIGGRGEGSSSAVKFRREGGRERERWGETRTQRLKNMENL
ncbi:hypothetical protein GW17_00019752 [Ensete ventricosum]|nr:hypothetical protein GW17_00019752 [Ensete ventricosum]